MAAPMKVCRFCGRRTLSPLSALNSRLYSTSSEQKEWKAVIGLEIHVQIASNSKLFSGSPVKFGSPLNSQVSFFDAALPGTLPVLNKRCVEAGLLTALALGCKINRISKFDRKHYFYADLPAGYQITQQRQPLASGGQLKFAVYSPKVHRAPFHKTVRFIQLQLEQDSGKSLHDAAENRSLIDLNRAGVGLMEIVTAPDFHDEEEAAWFVKEFQGIVKRLGVCSGALEEGAMRVDANISIHKPDTPFGERTEVKNLNSVRAVADAIKYEIKRQKKVVNEGKKVTNETRSFDVECGKTIAMRDKEKLLDYRFMPEPNLPPLCIYNDETVPKDLDPSQIINVDYYKTLLPVLPDEKREQLQEKYGIRLTEAMTIVRIDGFTELYESIVTDENVNVRKATNLLLNAFLGVLKIKNVSVEDCPIPPRSIQDVCILADKDIISGRTAGKVLLELLDDPTRNAQDVVEENDWTQISDMSILEQVCKEAISENPGSVKNYRKGRKQSIVFLAGKAQVKINDRGNTLVMREIITELLKK